MSNIQSFAVLQYGSTAYLGAPPMLLNMDFFSEAFDNGNGQTFVKYAPWGTGSTFTPVIISETISAVNTKLGAKSQSGNAELYIISINGIIKNSAFTLDSSLFVQGLATLNPTQTALMYRNQDQLTVSNYLVGGNFTYILNQIVVPVLPSAVFAWQYTTSLATETLDVLRDGVVYDFGAAGNFLANATPVGGNGASVQTITNLSGTQIELTSSVPDTFNITFTAI